MARQQRPRILAIEFIQYVIQDARFTRDVVRRAVLLPDCCVLIRLQVRKLDLVANPPEESFVRKIQGVQVCRENQHDIERHAEMPACAETQVIFLFLEGTIQRLKTVSGATLWRPMSSMMKTPLFALS